jgi:hypothetical protein
MEHFAIDLLSEYGTEEIPETKRPVVNPARRALDQRRRSLQSRLQQRQARYAALTLHPESDPDEMAQWLQNNPGTKLKLTYALAGAVPNQNPGSSLFPRGQEV